MLRGASLKITQWVYGIVVYTGSETKIKQNDSRKAIIKRSMMEQKMNMLILYIFIIQFLMACLGAMMGQIFDNENEYNAYYLELSDQDELTDNWLLGNFPQLIYIVKVGTWILLLTNFVPISLLVTVEMVKYIQAIFIEWDAELVSKESGIAATVQQSSLNEELG